MTTDVENDSSINGNTKRDVTPNPWPKIGRNSKFLIMDIPGITLSTRRRALVFICSRVCYKLTANQNKYVSVKGIKGLAKVDDVPIVMDSLFKSPVGIAAEDVKNLDTHRFQTDPSQKSYLLECAAIRKIVNDVKSVVHMLFCETYYPHNVSILFSRPFGEQQQMHVDDFRDDDQEKEQGEMVNALVALVNDTKLDIAGDDGERKTYNIPSGSMILFSGTCIHGGSSYTTSNVRLHIQFITKNAEEVVPESDNLIPTQLQCPIEDCSHNKDGKMIMEHQLYDHWDRYHLQDKGLSLGKYIAQKQGRKVLQCMSCRKVFFSKRGLTDHNRRCRGPRVSKKP